MISKSHAGGKKHESQNNRKSRKRRLGFVSQRRLPQTMTEPAIKTGVKAMVLPDDLTRGIALDPRRAFVPACEA
jgi:hypothetical protein